MILRRGKSAPGERFNELLKANRRRGVLRIEPRYGALKVQTTQNRRSAMSRTGDKETLRLRLLLFALTSDQSLELGVGESESTCRAPMSEQTRLDVFFLEWLRESCIGF
jgi:hypothetical protein